MAKTDPLGRVTRFTYDAQGNVTTITDPAGNVRRFTYEPTFNRVTSITDPLGNLTQFAYDPNGNLTTLTDPLLNRTTVTSNAFGQPLSTTDPLLNTSTFTYDAQGNLATVADPPHRGDELPGRCATPLPSFSTLSPWSAKHGMPGSDWRAFAAGKFQAPLAAGDRAAALGTLAQGLHALQDAYAHDLAVAGMWAHVLALVGLSVDPDNPLAEANQARATAAEAATRNAIRDFMKARGDKPTCP